MADWKKITKAEKELLNHLKDEPGMYIRQRFASSYYALYNKNGNHLRDIKYQWMNHLEPFFTKVQDDSRYETRFTLRPDAEISDKWLEAEREKDSQARADARAAREAVIRAEQQKATDWFECDGPYTVDFSGKYFSGSGEILFKADPVASINLWYQDSGEHTFEEMMRHPDNLRHFSQIKEMLRRANRE